MSFASIIVQGEALTKSFKVIYRGDSVSLVVIDLTANASENTCPQIRLPGFEGWKIWSVHIGQHDCRVTLIRDRSYGD